MKKGFTLIILISLFLTGKAQKLKIKTKRGQMYKEIYQINKSNKSKEGFYCKIYQSSRDTLIKGNYQNNKETGIWSYNDVDGNSFIKYNYDTEKIISIADKYTSIDTFIIEKNGNFVVDRIDTLPVYIGFYNEPKHFLFTNLRISDDIIKKRLTGRTVASFIINKHGKITNPTIEVSLSSKMDKQIIKTISNIEGKWIPAISGGKPVSSKITLLIDIPSNENSSMIAETSYLWKISMTYLLPK